jgi:uncharacterized protein (DUF488 family)
MATEEFRRAVDGLLAAATQSRIAIMCAEKLYWKCHRRLLSDYLVSQGVEVIHIMEPGKTSKHELTHGTIITKAGVIYPQPEPDESQMTLFDIDVITDME